jgi:hypothetical protein
VAEDAVEDIGLLEVVELIALADELARREAPIGTLHEQEGVAARTLEFSIRTAARPGDAIGALWNEIDLLGTPGTMGWRTCDARAYVLATMRCRENFSTSPVRILTIVTNVADSRRR